MASPVDAGRVGTNITTAGTTHNINVGSPAAGDLLIALIRVAGDDGGVGGQINSWTLIDWDAEVDATDDNTFLYAKFATGSEGATQTFITTNSLKVSAIVWRITGARATPTSAADFAGPVTFTTAANSADPPSLSVPGGPLDVLYLAVMAMGGEANTPTAGPSGYSNFVSANSGTGGAAATNCSCAGATKAAAASSSDNPGVFTHAAATGGGVAYTIVILPVIQNVTPIHVGRAQGLGARY